MLRKSLRNIVQILDEKLAKIVCNIFAKLFMKKIEFGFVL